MTKEYRFKLLRKEEKKRTQLLVRQPIRAGGLGLIFLGTISWKEGALVGISDAGGTKGGAGSFFAGVALICIGLYLVLRNILVTSGFYLGMGLFPFAIGGGTQAIPAGLFLITALAGFILIFRDGRSVAGWVVLVGSIAAILVGVLTSLHFVLRPMSLFEMVLVLGTLGAGIGLFLRSLRPH
jgi:hypothetical protein